MTRVPPFPELARRLSGDLLTDPISRHLVSTDGSIYRKTPAAVVYPRDARDVAETVRFARRHGLTAHARGAGSGLCGAALGQGIVVDFSRYMNRMLDLNRAAATMTCEPGFRMGELEVALAGTGLFFPPDPSSGEYATLGGMTGTNASGAHSVKYGNVVDYLEDAELVLDDGTIVTLSGLRSSAIADLPERFRKLAALYQDHRDAIESAYPATRFNTAGYNLRGLVTEAPSPESPDSADPRDGAAAGPRLDLRRLLAGAEGTLAVITRLTFRLLKRPPHDGLVVAFMPDIVSSARVVQALLPKGPAGIEVMDKSLLALARSQDERLRRAIPGDVDNVLLIEFDGFSSEECAALTAEAGDVVRATCPGAGVYEATRPEEKAAFWAVRKAAVPILYKLKGERKILALIEDAAVPTDRLVDYFTGIYEILNRRGVRFVTYGHIAKGLLHTRPLLNLKDPDDVDLLRLIADDLYDLVERLDGSVSGEHGDGRIRSAYVRRRYPSIYPLFLETKALFDPDGVFNPEILTHHDPDQMKRDLRFGADYRAAFPATPLLNWPEGLLVEIEKCHGCSKCTTTTSATRMCPVYKATRREEAGPKAKANLLRGLISGAIDDAALYARTFQWVIDHCVTCGSCAHECPSAVNIPKMAVEARAQYVKRFGPSASQRALTSAELGGRLLHPVAAVTGPVLGAVMDFPPLKRAVQLAVGVSEKRPAIRFSGRPLARRIPALSGGGMGPKVLYFAGCYAGYIEPVIGESLVNVLTRMGMTVLTPDQHCCGLPMLSKGMVDAARAKVLANLEKWNALLDLVDYVTVSCSSCGYALMKDWLWLLDDGRTRRVAEKMIHVTALIDRYFDRLPLDGERKGPASGVMAYHAPCHLKIQPDPDASVRLLSRLPGMKIQDLKSNCCGMVGSWGMAAANYDLSVAIAGDMLTKLNASGAGVVVTDCPTCRMQLKDVGKAAVRHPVEVVF